ncbi:MAG: sigma-70 family RNA polymerase sigma factor [Oscillospiraceae bacterium]
MCHDISDFSDKNFIPYPKDDFLITFEFLAKKYMPLINGRAAFFSKYGIENEELIQEGLLGLYSAFQHYDSTREASFKTFAAHCINNKMISFIRTLNTNQSIPMKNYVPLNEDFENFLIDDAFYSQDPQEIFFKNEDMENQKNIITSSLSAFEKEIINFYLNGYSYKETADILSCSEKSVDNAIQRVKHKLRNATK